MNFKYKFRWRRIGKWFWSSVTAIGHRFEPEQNKMLIYLEDGSIREVAEWSRCEVFLGADWVLATKRSMEAEAGQKMNLAVENA